MAEDLMWRYALDRSIYVLDLAVDDLDPRFDIEMLVNGPSAKHVRADCQETPHMLASIPSQCD